MASPSDGVPPESWEMAADLEARLIIQQQQPSSKDEDLKTIPTIPTTTSSSSNSSKNSYSGVDEFLLEALEKPRERLSILRMENDILNFIRDPTQQHLEFEDLPTSYLRLAAHRVAQHYFLHSLALPDPNLESSRILLTKTKTTNTTSYPVRLAHIPVNIPTTNQDQDNNNNNNNAVVKVAAIKQRSQSQSHSHFGTTTNNPSTANNHLLKTVEERKQEYNRARARIFSAGGVQLRQQTPPSPSPANSHHHFHAPSELHPPDSRHLGESSRSPTPRVDKGNNKVAILRDREVERKDPDYDRSYDRYMQRFDPGFGFNGGGPYAIPAMYTPVLNYNTEFPQLRPISPGHRPRLTIQHQPRQMSPHMHNSWVPASSPTSAHGYGPPEGIIPPFNSNHLSIHSAPGMYLHSPQYVTSPRPGMAFLHPREQLQSFPQPQQQQPEGSFGLARPR